MSGRLCTGCLIALNIFSVIQKIILAVGCQDCLTKRSSKRTIVDTFPWLCSTGNFDWQCFCAVLEYHLKADGVFCRGCLIRVNFLSVIQKQFLTLVSSISAVGCHHCLTKRYTRRGVMDAFTWLCSSEKW